MRVISYEGVKKTFLQPKNVRRVVFEKNEISLQGQFKVSGE